MTTDADPYLRGAQAVWRTIYRGRRSLTGEPLTWDDLPDSDRAACMAIARPVVDAVLHRLVVDFPDQTCPACGLEHPGADCQQPDLFGGES